METNGAQTPNIRLPKPCQCLPLLETLVYLSSTSLLLLEISAYLVKEERTKTELASMLPAVEEERPSTELASMLPAATADFDSSAEEDSLQSKKLS